jgi:hypothetical protein
MNNCPTCHYPINDDNDFHWCPACGTLNTPDGDTLVPELAVQAVIQKGQPAQDLFGNYKS